MYVLNEFNDTTGHKQCMVPRNRTLYYSWYLYFLNFSLAIVLKIKIFQIFDYMEDLISNVPYTKSRNI